MVRAIAALLVLLVSSTVAEAGDTVADLARRAREQARLWQADAELVHIEVTAGEDGTVSSGSTPSHFARFNFLSPSRGQGLTVIAGGPKLESQAWQTRERFAGPIPERFTDLRASVTEARKHGLRGAMIAATLRVYPRALDQTPRAYWSITGSQTPGAAALMIYVDAETGAFVRIAEPTRAPSRGRQTASLPSGTGFDFDALRRVADQASAGVNPGFKLFAVVLHLAHDRLLNQRAEARNVPVGFTQARFHYFRETPPYAWESLEIEIQREPPEPDWATRYTVPKSKPLLAEIGFNPPRPAEGFWQPQAIPTDLRPAQAILERLQQVFYARRSSVGDGKAEIWLGRSGDPYRPVRHGPREDWLAVFTARVPPGQWSWWTVVERPSGAEQRKTSQTERHNHYQFIFIDARTGAETVTCTEPQAILTGQRKPLAAIACP